MKHDKKVWDFLMKLLEERMRRGEFTVIDATMSKPSDVSKFKTMIDRYKYHVLCVDFTDVPIETTKERNLKRPDYKQVPEFVIDKMYERFESPLPSWVKMIKPNEFEKYINFKPLDFSNYEKIHHIGDIHGCHTVLMEYLKDGINPKDLYIFCGDYLDRGIEGSKVINYLFRIMNLPNVILLEGNHEIHLKLWSNDEPPVSDEFKTRTVKELEINHVSKKATRVLYKKLRQLAYYTYHGKEVLVTHGGLSIMPKNLMYVATEQLIKGVGSYGDNVNQTFLGTTSDTMFQIHGHRNIQEFPTQVNDRTFNLEGKVENGGDLRTVTLSLDGFTIDNVENTVYNEDRFNKRMNICSVEVDNKTFLEELKCCELVKRRPTGDGIYSFNFKSDVFFKKLWDESPATLKARGMFINEETTEIVARSYEKFFNMGGERPETLPENLQNTLKFPIDIYCKENGYLGILGYNSSTDTLVVASKSTTQGDYANWFRTQLFNIIDTDKKERELKDYLKNENVSLVFEVIETVNDPHMIEYQSNRLILLDVIKRTPKFDKLSFEHVKTVAKKFEFLHKELFIRLNNWEDFLLWQIEVMQEDFTHNGKNLEGFVLECEDNFMTKVKLPYYNFWKRMRSVKDRFKNKSMDNRGYDDAEVIKFIEFLKGCEKDVLEEDIITLRKLYQNSNHLKSK